MGEEFREMEPLFPIDVTVLDGALRAGLTERLRAGPATPSTSVPMTVFALG